MTYKVTAYIKDAPLGSCLEFEGGDEFEEAVVAATEAVTGEGGYLRGPLWNGDGAYAVIPSSSIEYVVVEEGE